MNIDEFKYYNSKKCVNSIDLLDNSMSLNNKILVGIVLYNTQMERLIKSIESLKTQVECIILYNNGGVDKEKLRFLQRDFKNIKIIGNGKNTGIAYALNRLMEEAIVMGFEWVLTLDQDSMIAKNMMEKYKKYMMIEDVAIICPFVIDRRRAYMTYADESKDFEIVNRCITSGSFMRTTVWDKVGRFDEWLFIDLVDNDYCKRVNIFGYKILRVNRVILDQEFGEIIPKKQKIARFYIKLGKLLNNKNIQKLSYKKIVHSNRVYYTNRNIIYLNKKYKKYGGIGYDNYNCNTYWGFWICFCLPSLVRGKGKLKIVKSIIKGVHDGRDKARETRSFEYYSN